MSSPNIDGPPSQRELVERAAQEHDGAILVQKGPVLLTRDDAATAGDDQAKAGAILTCNLRLDRTEAVLAIRA